MKSCVHLLLVGDIIEIFANLAWMTVALLLIRWLLKSSK